MSDVPIPAVVQDAQRYDAREDYLHNIPWCPALDRLFAHVEGLEARRILSAAHIERLEAERDALLAEHEAAAPLLVWDGAFEGLFDEMWATVDADHCSSGLYTRYQEALRAAQAAYDNAERVIHGE